MSWVLLDDNFPHHPKTVAAGREAGWLFVCGLAYCRKYHTGGSIPRAALSTLGAGANPRRLVEALVSVGLWDACEAGWEVHDYGRIYADEQDKAAHDEQQQDRVGLRRVRQEAGRKGGLAKASKSGLANGKQNSTFASAEDGMDRNGASDHFLEEKKREADFAAFWQAYPRKDGKQAARSEWMRLKPTDDQQRQMAADLERRCRSSQWLKDGGQFIPHARTYLHQRRFEDGFDERPHVTERTINVIRGFEDVNKETA